MNYYYQMMEEVNEWDSSGHSGKGTSPEGNPITAEVWQAVGLAPEVSGESALVVVGSAGGDAGWRVPKYEWAGLGIAQLPSDSVMRILETTLFSLTNLVGDEGSHLLASPMPVYFSTKSNHVLVVYS